jgi:hypothetical protein
MPPLLHGAYCSVQCTLFSHFSPRGCIYRFPCEAPDREGSRTPNTAVVLPVVGLLLTNPKI